VGRRYRALIAEHPRLGVGRWADREGDGHDGHRPPMKPSNVLSTGEQLEAWKRALSMAVGQEGNPSLSQDWLGGGEGLRQGATRGGVNERCIGDWLTV
jgi:hypothetical protein